jgi:DNA repair protein RecO
MKQTDHGILLHRISFSETSLITTFFTRKSGIQQFIYQGGKKKSGNLFALGMYEITFYKRPDSELGKINQVELLINIQEIIISPIKTVISFFIADVLYQSIKTEEGDIQLFNFLENEIQKLSNEKEIQLFPALFLIRFIEHLGISPIIHSTDNSYFDMKQGEFTSNPKNLDNCIKSEASNTLRNYLFDSETDLIEFNKYRKEIVSILITYISIHIPNFNGKRSLQSMQEILS